MKTIPNLWAPKGTVLYKVRNLESARKFLSGLEKPVILTNSEDSLRYYGIMVLRDIFKILRSEFPSVTGVIVNEDGDAATEDSLSLLGKDR